MRKILSLVLAIIMTVTCAVGAMTFSAAAENTANVRYYGHQRTTTAGTTYGIRLIALVDDLSPDAVGFDIAIIHEDGSVGKYSKEVTEVYESVTGNIDGVEDIIEASELGGKYICTLVINNIPATKGYIGILCSVYGRTGTVKTADETEQVIYNGTEHWTQTYGVGDVVDATLYDWADHEGEKDLKYAYGDNQQTEACLAGIWDGNLTAGRCTYYDWDAAGSYTTASFAEAVVVDKITLVAPNVHSRNKGDIVQLSTDGEKWVDVYTISDADGSFVVDASWEMKYLEISVDDNTLYQYVRYYDAGGMGYSLMEIQVNEKRAVSPMERVSAAYHSFGDGAGGQKTNYIFGADLNGVDMGGNPEALKFVFDGVTDTAYVQYFNWDNAGSYLTATLPEGTVISKLTLATIWQPTRNLGTAIQASVDGEDWTTLYTLSEADGSFVAGVNEWALETFDIYVEDSTEYNYIRVYDTAGNGYCFAEVEVYTEEIYNSTFANLLTTVTP